MRPDPLFLDFPQTADPHTGNNTDKIVGSTGKLTIFPLVHQQRQTRRE